MSPLRKERRGLAGVWEPPAPVMLPLPGRSCMITSRGGNPTDPPAPGALEEERGEGFAHATVFLRCPFKAGALPAKPGDTTGKKEPGWAGGGCLELPPRAPSSPQELWQRVGGTEPGGRGSQLRAVPGLAPLPARAWHRALPQPVTSLPGASVNGDRGHSLPSLFHQRLLTSEHPGTSLPGGKGFCPVGFIRVCMISLAVPGTLWPQLLAWGAPRGTAAPGTPKPGRCPHCSDGSSTSWGGLIPDQERC